MTYLTYNQELRSETDQAVIANLRRKGWQDAPPKPVPNAYWQDGQWVIPPPPTYTANDWLQKEGYGPTQLVTLLDLSAQLLSAGKTSPKLDAVKGWTNALLSEFVQSSEPKESWGASPFGFNETVTEAFEILNQ